MDYEFEGFTFHFDLNGSGNVVEIDTPQIGPLGPQGLAYGGAGITVADAQAVAQGLVRLLGGG